MLEKAVSKSVLACKYYVYKFELECPLCENGNKILRGRQQKCVGVVFTITMEQINETTTVTDVTSTTTFLETGTRETVSFETNTSKGDYEIKEQAMRDFFAKPICLVTGTWAAGYIQGQDLAVVNPAYELVNNPMWASKWEGYRLARGTAVVRFEFNAEPFQQGLLRMWWQPEMNGINLTTHLKTMASKFMFPGITMDARNSSGEIRVPYVAPFDWWDSKSNEFGWGNIFVSVYSPLFVGSGSTDATYSVYLSFEDFELACPVAPQMESAPYEPWVLVDAEPQMEKRGFKQSLDSEHRALNERPISSALSLAAKACDSLAGMPQLSPVMTPSAWALRTASGVSSSLGWSSSPNLQAPKFQTMMLDPFMSVPDGVSNIPIMGFSADRGVELTDKLTVRQEDEMSFAFLKKQWGFIDNYEWKKDDLPGNPLWTGTLCPAMMKWSDSVTHNSKVAVYGVGPPAYYLSKCFSVWRGAIRVRIRFAKTDFHTGRLCITWTPGKTSFVTPTIGTSSYSIREIVDLSNCSVVDLELPYLIADNYIPVATPSGQLRIQVLNPLRAPATCEPFIKFVIEVCGGDDFELQVPTSTVSLLPFNPQMESGMIGEAKPVAATRLHESGPTTVERSRYCIGEHFTSIKQLLSRNSRMPATTAQGGGQSLINPWYTSIVTINTTSGALESPVYGGDIYSFLSTMYVYFRGDARFLFSVLGTNNHDIMTKAIATPATFATRYSVESITSVNTLVADSAWRTISGGAPVSKSSGPCSELILNNKLGAYGVTVPYSSRGYGSQVVVQQADSTPPNDPSRPLQFLDLVVSQALNTMVQYRSFADNFQLLMYIGCPPVLEAYS